MEITYTIEENNKTIKQILKERLFISDSFDISKAKIV